MNLKKSLTLQLAHVTKVSHNVNVYRFSLPCETDVLGLPTGKHVSLSAIPHGSEKRLSRSYTPISSNEDQGYLDLMIKSYPQGKISAHMTTLAPGDTIDLKGPTGNFVYRRNMCRSIGMIAGGTGITPMLQILKAIHRDRPADKTRVDLIYANVNQDDILLKDELLTLTRTDPRIFVYFVLNNPPPLWSGGKGFVTDELVKRWLPPPTAPRTKILVCGPPPMVAAMKKITEELGFEKARLVSKADDQVFCF